MHGRSVKIRAEKARNAKGPDLCEECYNTAIEIVKEHFFKGFYTGCLTFHIIEPNINIKEKGLHSNCETIIQKLAEEGFREGNNMGFLERISPTVRGRDVVIGGKRSTKWTFKNYRVAGEEEWEGSEILNESLFRYEDTN